MKEFAFATIKEAGNELNVCVGFLQYLISENKLPAIEVSQETFVLKTDLEFLRVKENPKSKKARGRKQKEPKITVHWNLTEEQALDRLMTIHFFQKLVDDIYDFVNENFPTPSDEDAAKIAGMIWRDWWSKQ